MTGTNKNTVSLGFQWEHVAGTAEIVWFGVIFHALHGGEGALGGGDSCGGVYVVNGNGESCFVVVGVVAYHLGQSELLDIVYRHGHTDKTTTVDSHKIYHFGGGILGGTDKVTLVFPIWIVGHQNHFSLTQILQGFLNCVEVRHSCSPCV